MRYTLTTLIVLMLAPHFALHAASPVSKPNIIFILADDLGWADVGFHGGKVATPNLDQLAAEGVELLQHYVCPVCSPTRSSLLSGRYSTRFNVTTPQNERAYRWDTVTLASALKSVGYETALCGKWHLGSKSEWGPQKFGFDHSYGSLAGGVGPWDHRYKLGEYTTTWHRNGTLIDEQGHVTELITQEAIGWLASRTDKPFLLYVPFTAVHIPIREPEEFVMRVPAEIAQPSLRQYAASVMHLDDSVGRILATLERTGKASSTIVVFGSDNGGTPTAKNDDTRYPLDGYDPGPSGGSNLPLRGNKGEIYEGGIRTPALVRWPGQLKPGKFNGVAHISDWMPTFCTLAGYTAEKELKWDGQNIMPQLLGHQPPTPRTLYTAAPGYRAVTLRDGDWKLIVKNDSKGRPGEPELYDLNQDPHETKNLAPSKPELVAILQEKLNEVAQADKDAVVND